MPFLIDIQHASLEEIPLSDKQIESLASLALRDHCKKAELTLRLVSIEEITQLNSQYRNKHKPTNVLAFPSNLPKEISLDYPFLGDIILCPQVLKEESIQYEKDLVEHWALIIIHGVLHLLGYDHNKDEETIVMQSKEIALLAELGYKNPYHEEDSNFE